jgi:hypothetical protein
MKYRNLIVTLGFVVVIIQFLGFPQAWRNGLYTLAGMSIIAFGYLSDKEKKVKMVETKTGNPTSTVASS